MDKFKTQDSLRVKRSKVERKEEHRARENVNGARGKWGRGTPVAK